MPRKRYNTFLLQNFTAENISIRSSTMKNGKSETHFHDCIEFELITGGNGYQILNGVRRNISKHTFTMLGPLDYHEVGVLDNELKTYTLMFRPGLLPDDYIHCFASPGGFVLNLDADIYDLVLSLFTVMENSVKCRINDESLYRELIGCILKNTLKNSIIANVSVTYGEKFRDIISYINLHFKENPSVTEIADLFHYNKNYICNLFEKNLGITYVEYINSLKVRYAEIMLRTTDLPISSICFECGFGSISGFNRTFRKITGKAPREMRSSE